MSHEARERKKGREKKTKVTEKQGSILQRKILPRFEDARNEEEQRRGDREKERERERKTVESRTGRRRAPNGHNEFLPLEIC